MICKMQNTITLALKIEDESFEPYPPRAKLKREGMVIGR